MSDSRLEHEIDRQQWCGGSSNMVVVLDHHGKERTKLKGEPFTSQFMFQPSPMVINFGSRLKE